MTEEEKFNLALNTLKWYSQLTVEREGELIPDKLAYPALVALKQIKGE